MAKVRGLRARKRPPCGPIDVAAAWGRIEACLAAFSPDLPGHLRAGAKEKDVLAFEKAIRRELPQEVRQSFLTHDGQAARSWDAVINGITFFSVKESRAEWKMWVDLADRVEDIDEHFRDHGSSTPEAAIRLGYTSRDWIELASTGGSNYFGVDLGPGENGLRGQVINFGRDEEHKTVLAWSWGWFLHDLADEMERGNFRLGDGEAEEAGLILIAPAPAHDNFYNVHREWSKAKLGGGRPFDPMTAEELRPLRGARAVQEIAGGIAASGDLGGLPILADALEEAGCTNKRLLNHCRKPGDHGTGCWAVDLLLGKPSAFCRG